LAATRDSHGHLTALSATDALGATRTYRYTNILGLARTTSASQPGGSGCNAASSATSYDANGNVSQRTDFVGNATRYDQYDLTRNLELHRIEGYGSANALNISTQWHPFWRLKTRVAEPKRITTWVYNGQPDPSNGNAILRCAPAEAKVVGEPIAVICKRIEQATTDDTGALGFAATLSGKRRVWTYTYNAFGQMLRENGPRTDVADTTTYTYYTDTVFNAAGEGHTIGDLRSITNAAAHVTKYTLYDRAGRLLRRLEANGAETRYAYSPRGWLTAEVLRYQGQERFTSYTYDKVGQLTQVIAPNDYVMDFSYDAAHRLTGLRDSLGNRIQYTLDGAGNRLLEDVTDAGGVLVKRTNRLFDQLGRLQNVKVTQ
ncbi:MAG: RHS repeat protein, partial [Uliginosibacterium sp.]|nr:RHS repeat protein [Uliginosibacterium sp.]